MSKPRFTPALTQYEGNAAKGLCSFCGEPLDPTCNAIRITERIHKLHSDCWKAILVLERFKPSPKIMSGLTASASVVFDDREYQEDSVISRYFRNKEHQAP